MITMEMGVSQGKDQGENRRVKGTTGLTGLAQMKDLRSIIRGAEVETESGPGPEMVEPVMIGIAAETERLREEETPVKNVRGEEKEREVEKT